MNVSASQGGEQRLELLVARDIDGRARVWGAVETTLRFRDGHLLAECPPRDLAPEAQAAAEQLALATADSVGLSTIVVGCRPGSPPTLIERFAGPRPAAATIEQATGTDLAELQARLADDEPLPGEVPTPVGCALSTALTGSDPHQDLAPCGGTVELLRLPSGPGLRAIPLVEEGETLPRPGAAILQLLASGRDRQEALARLRRALAATFVWVRGGNTDKAFVAGVLAQPEIEAGVAEPRWLEGLMARGEHLARRGAELALVEAAIAGYEAELDRAKARFFATARRGRPDVGGEPGRALELSTRGHAYLCRVAKLAARRYRVEIDGHAIEATHSARSRSGEQLTVAGRRHRVFVVERAHGLEIEVDGDAHFVELDQGGVVRAPGPAVVVSVTVKEGDTVAVGDRLVVLEAMKMATDLSAEFAGRVRRVLVRPNVQVHPHAPLVVIEPELRAEGAAHRPRGERLRFGALAGAEAAPTDLVDLRRLILGYDVDARALAAGFSPHPGTEAGAAELEEEILGAFVDIASLFRRLPDEEMEDDGRRSLEEYLFTYLRDLDGRGAGLPAAFVDKLRQALSHYGVATLDRNAELEESLFRIATAQRRQALQVPLILALLERRREAPEGASERLRELLGRLIAETREREPAVHDLAREVRYRLFDRPLVVAAREGVLAAAAVAVDGLAASPGADERAAHLRVLIDCPQPIQGWLIERSAGAPPALVATLLEVLVRRLYRIRPLGEVRGLERSGQPFAVADYEHRGSNVRLFATFAARRDLAAAFARAVELANDDDSAEFEKVIDLFLHGDDGHSDLEATARAIGELLAAPSLPAHLRRVAVALVGPGGIDHQLTFRRAAVGAPFAEERLVRGLHPMLAERLQVWRLRHFALERLDSAPGVFLFRGIGLSNPKDERLFALAEVRDLTAIRDAQGQIARLPQLEHVLLEALAGIRVVQSRRGAAERLHWNRLFLYIWPPIELRNEELNAIVHRLSPLAEGLGLEKVVVRGRIPHPATGELEDWVIEVSNPGGGAQALRFRRPSDQPLAPLDDYAQKVIELKRRGVPYPYEIVKLLAPSPLEASGSIPPGEFIEHDLDEAGELAPVSRPPGKNKANIVAGVIRSFTDRYPEGMTRVILLGDPTRGMGSLAEPECRRIIAGLALALKMGVPLEWVAISAGAKIAMDSGTENMDWISLVLRRIVEYTQAGGEINILVPGINVGAQPYWNAEATMLMHTRGILVMTPDAAMVLTGKQALDYSGGVSAEDNQGIGGYERVMGPNGQAQYFAADLGEACRILLAHYEHAFVAPGEKTPRRAPTSDRFDRDVRDFPHGGDFQTVGEIFSDTTNPGRKHPFDIRRVMRAVSDQDHEPLERWFGMRDAEIAVSWDAHVGGYPVAMLGFESRPLARLGWVPVYGPDQWTGGTLFPQSSRKIARAINAASGSRPLVVIANLSGFDGSPESMRNWQLEYGAEIGRAVVNFKGPIVFVVVSRYHGGAFVVFSKVLHDNMQVAAIEGSFASVIGGAPAAAVVFAREVDRRTKADPRLAELERQLADPAQPDKAKLRARLAELRDQVRSEKLGEVAEEFDGIHSIERAQRVGSVDEIIPAHRLRPWVIEALERGLAKERERAAAADPGLKLPAPI